MVFLSTFPTLSEPMVRFHSCSHLDSSRTFMLHTQSFCYSSLSLLHTRQLQFLIVISAAIESLRIPNVEAFVFPISLVAIHMTRRSAWQTVQYAGSASLINLVSFDLCQIDSAAPTLPAIQLPSVKIAISKSLSICWFWSTRFPKPRSIRSAGCGIYSAECIRSTSMSPRKCSVLPA